MSVHSSHSRLHFAPEVSIHLPDGSLPDLSLFEDDREFFTKVKFRDFVIQGELLRYYVIISFDKLRNELINSDKNSSGLFDQIHRKFANLNFSVLFMRCRSEGNIQMAEPTFVLRKSSTIGQIPISIGYGPLNCDHHPHNDRIIAIAAQIPPHHFKNGNLIYELVNPINTDETNINVPIMLRVEAMLDHAQFDLFSSTFVSNYRATKISADHPITIISPLKITQTTKVLNVENFAIFQIENISPSKNIVISKIDLKSIQRTADTPKKSDEDLIYNAELITSQLPLTILPLEVHTILVKLNANLVAISECAKENTTTYLLKNTKFVMTFTWNTPNIAHHIKSEVPILLPPVHLKNLIANFEITPNPIVPNHPFQIIVRVVNMTRRIKLVSVEIPNPTLGPPSDNDLENDNKSNANAPPRTNTIETADFLFSEKMLHLGSIEPYSESSGSFHGFALKNGPFALRGINIIDEIPDKEPLIVHTLDLPLELSNTYFTP